MFILRSVQLVGGIHVGPFPDRESVEIYAQWLGLTDYSTHVMFDPSQPDDIVVVQ